MEAQCIGVDFLHLDALPSSCSPLGTQVSKEIILPVLPPQPLPLWLSIFVQEAVLPPQCVIGQTGEVGRFEEGPGMLPTLAGTLNSPYSFSSS